MLRDHDYSDHRHVGLDASRIANPASARGYGDPEAPRIMPLTVATGTARAWNIVPVDAVAEQVGDGGVAPTLECVAPAPHAGVGAGTADTFDVGIGAPPKYQESIYFRMEISSVGVFGFTVRQP
ncbi:hypothetical protein AB0B25_27755 [Nocardia sp. NPDC049190]|uniref:hypothetical protein n=1 Tax=Nocardia sp. NPDC049190 TaxID=3155650 RepID=UPI0033CB67F8